MMAQSAKGTNVKERAAKDTVTVSVIDKETGSVAGSPQAVAVEIAGAQ